MRAEQFFFGNPFESEFDLPPGFMGGVAVQEEQQQEKEQQQEETTPPFTLPSGGGQSNLDILRDALVGSGLLSTTIDFGGPALAGAATGIGAGGTPVFNAFADAATGAAAGAAGADAAASGIFGLNPITSAYRRSWVHIVYSR